MSVMQSPPGPETIIDGRRVLYFAGCGYLGLQGDPRVIDAACEATRRYGIHTATSRGGYGDSPPVLEVEQRAAEFFGAEDAFYYPTGYAGAAILAEALKDRFDHILYEEGSHYSVVSGALSSGLDVHSFVGPDRLADVMRKAIPAPRRVLVMVDGVSPVTGSSARVDAYLELVTKYKHMAVCIDDAHGVGVIGECGRGTIESWSKTLTHHAAYNTSIDQGKLYLCATLSKAIGGYGGIIPGRSAFIAELKARSGWYRGASALPPAVAAATARALQIVMAEPALRQSLKTNVMRLRDGLRSLGLDTPATSVPIICLELGEAANMQRIQRELLARNIAIAYIARYSGVGPQGALRIAVFANHTPAMIDRLIDELRRIL